ncbi:MAG: hypothetical protein KJ043_22820, partial [Anaerolineae bacterium]|nr:hypothetical protein [Anaerolineae bacterium]
MGNLRVLIIFIGLLLVVAVFTYPSWRPRPIIETADDIFPELDAQLRPLFDELPSDIQTIYLTLRQENTIISEALVTARLTPPERLIEEMPNVSNAVRTIQTSFAPVVLPEDETERELPFYQPLYEAFGEVSIYRYPDDRLLLRLDNFSVVHGPDLRVYIVVLRDPLNTEEVGNDFIDL